MRKSRMLRLSTRLPEDVVALYDTMATAARPRYKLLCDVLVAYARAAQQPPLRDDTMQLLYLTVEAAGYESADALVQDLCRSLERAMRANRGALREEEAGVDNDILEMFNSVLNEKEVAVRKHT